MPILDLFTQALIAGLIIAMVAAPLGCFVVWRRMAYFGDAISHSALLGVILGLLWQVNASLAILPVAVGVALVLTWLQADTRFSSDTLLGIIAHMALASGIVMLALNSQIQIDLMSYLFGDILAISPHDLMFMYAFAAVMLMLLCLFWRRFLLLTLHEDIARIHGIPATRYRLLLMLMIAVTVAISIKLVGLLLITAMLVIPPATARFFASGPAQMAFLAIAYASAAVCLGLSASWKWDTPAGPSIVLTAGILFLTSYLMVRIWRVRQLHAAAQTQLSDPL
jgi:zinc transport system permease protein